LNSIFRSVFFVWLFIVISGPTFTAQSAITITTASPQSQEKTITTTEPGIAKLAAIFQSADIVALVKITSGDTESYEGAVYKSKVIKNFKGTKDGEDIYFGPFWGQRLGWEYVVFLLKGNKPLSPISTAQGGYGTIPYSKIFMEGYTAMESSYECVFPGSNSCDYAVRVCTDYVRLPKTVHVYPAKEGMPFGCGWARKSVFLSTLASVAKTAR
jgi:hypothetical protein